jgi:hypothetical protein
LTRPPLAESTLSPKSGTQRHREPVEPDAIAGVSLAPVGLSVGACGVDDARVEERRRRDREGVGCAAWLDARGACGEEVADYVEGELSVVVAECSLLLAGEVETDDAPGHDRGEHIGEVRPLTCRG